MQQRTRPVTRVGSTKSISCSLVIALSSALAACTAEHDAKPAPVSTTASTRAPSAEEAQAAPQKKGPLAFPPQPGWIEEATTSSMRKAQFLLPRAEGDTDDASLVVYFFGAQGGGSREANIARWVTQFEQPDGRASSDALATSERSVNGMRVHEVELAGTYVAETTPGSGERVNKPAWRLLASIVEAAEGPYYVKLVGPEATIARWTSSYRAFISELAPGG